MANQEQLAILKKGVEVWNEWRINNVKKQNREYQRAFRQRGTVLAFPVPDLRAADLHGANLREANLSSVDLRESNLSEADLRYSDLIHAELGEANFRGASFTGANLWGARLLGNNFLQAKMGDTNLGNLDLSEAMGLEYVAHSGPSSLGIDTIAKSNSKIPEVFLQGCGLSDWEIESTKLYIPNLNNDEINKILYKMYDLRASQALQIAPLFISYSHTDGTFVDKLEKFLNNRGIRFWRDVHDMKSGKIETQIDHAIRQNPTVLLILSEHSIKSDWVEHEVKEARKLEKEIGRDVLCPIALDDGWKNSPWPKRVMEQVMEYNILDFSVWKDDSKFGNTFNKLIDGLGLFYRG